MWKNSAYSVYPIYCFRLYPIFVYQLIKPALTVLYYMYLKFSCFNSLRKFSIAPQV